MVILKVILQLQVDLVSETHLLVTQLCSEGQPGFVLSSDAFFIYIFCMVFLQFSLMFSLALSSTGFCIDVENGRM